MSTPFMTPSQSRARRALAAQQRQRKRRQLAIGLGCLLAFAVLIGAVVLATRSHGAKHRDAPGANTAAAVGAGAKHLPAPALSPAGLVLSQPALALAGIGTPRKDPLRVPFHEPPTAGLLFNLSTGQVLWQHNPFKKVHIASLTKMMTALLAVQSAPPSAHVLITKEAIASGGSKVGVLPLGKHVRLETMLYGLMLPSGNDAAIALAQHIAGSVDAFVARMNAEAAKLGMGCTHYTSPSGYFDLHNYSCAADLAVLAHVDLEQRRIARVVDTYSAALPFPIKGGKLYLYNNNPLLIYHYPGTTGLKTGFTASAGRCLVATAQRGGVRLGVVLLHSPNPGTQARQLLDRGFKEIYHQKAVSEPPIPSGA